MKNLLLFLTVVLAGRAAAQCPFYVTCPAGTQLYCDYSTNDTLYWKSAPQTWNPNLLLSDLPETNIDLSIVARDSCGGQDISVEYTLFLDLDGNDTVETAVRSNAALPSGNVLYNNILSPNYTLGDTIAFDHRSGLPDSMKYRFGLELTRIADLVIANLKWTTGIEALNYSVAKLPLGKHRIVWHIEQGGVEQFCEYAIEVKDCAPPEVTCAAVPQVEILPTGNISLWAGDFIQSASDNITPENLLVTAVRHLGTGTGFPLNDQGEAQDFVTFDCCMLGTQQVEVWVKDKAGLVSQCTTYVIIQDGLGNCPSEGCNGGYLVVCSKTGLSEGIEEMRYQLDVTPDLFPAYTRVDSLANCALFEYILLGSDLMLTPFKNDNPLNGVTTYDLILISKHILAVEPLNTPYKMIAADANKSGSVSTFDIVELRRLILGIYTHLPNNNSWRFVDKEFQFPNFQNPFQSVFPENIVLPDWMGTPSQFEFAGVKVGDVNNTAVANASTPPLAEERAAYFLALPEVALRNGEILQIPIRSVETANWLGLQFSLEFDPELIDIEAIESSSLPDFNQNNWAVPQAGRLTLSWSDAQAQPANIFSGDEVFSLRLKARANIQLSQVLKILENPTLRAEAYDLEGLSRPLQIVFTDHIATETTRVFAPQPNPTTAGATVPLQLWEAGDLKIEVRELSGKLRWVHDLSLQKGSHVLDIPASAMPQAGMYLWSVQTGKFFGAGKISRI